MKKFALILIVGLFLSSNLFASPLIFKSTKIINNDKEFFLIPDVVTAQYEKVKIIVINEKPDDEKPNDDKKKSDESEFLKPLPPIPLEDTNQIFVEGIENKDVFPLAYSGTRFINKIIELPPSKIRIRVKGKGTYKIFIWAK